MASLPQRRRGFPRDAPVERRQAEIDAIHGEAGGFDAQGLDDGGSRKRVAFEICVSVATFNLWLLLIWPA